MNIAELLPEGSIAALAGQLGISHEQAQSGAQALLPSILSGMGQQAGPAGADNASQLDSHVNALGGPALIDNVLGDGATDTSKGNALLGGMFGSKDASREVAAQASQTSGLDPALLKQMLPILAMLVAGYLSKRSSGQQGGLGGILGSVLGSLGAGAGSSGAGSSGGLDGGLGGGLGDILGSILGGGKR